MRVTEIKSGRRRNPNLLCKVSMEIGGGRRIPEAVFVEILARFPLRDIAKFKTVCKSWKSVIESSYFRSAFVSLRKRSSSSWSLMFVSEYSHPLTKVISFHGCETWALPKPLVDYIVPLQPNPKLHFYVASSNGLTWVNVYDIVACVYKYFVGNPVLQQWVEFPPPPEASTATGLVTRVDENGVVSSFKMVKTCEVIRVKGTCEWRVCVYSSETGLWTFKRLFSAVSFCYGGYYPPVNVNGKLYMWGRGLDPTDPGVLVAYDFYGSEEDDQCRVIPLPLPYNRDVRRCLTTSRGDVFYIEVISRKLKVWRLNDNCKSNEWWQLFREEIELTAVGFDVDCTPMAMNPYDSDIVYLWSRQHKSLVLGNLETQEFIVYHESENWSSSGGSYSINTLDSKRYVKEDRLATSVIMLSQYVLSQWIDSVPRPPFLGSQ